MEEMTFNLECMHDRTIPGSVRVPPICDNTPDPTSPRRQCFKSRRTVARKALPTVPPFYVK